MCEEQSKNEEIIPNNKRKFYKKKYPIVKTKYVIFVLASVLLIWNVVNMFKPDQTFTDYYSDYINKNQAYKNSFVPNSIVAYFHGNVKKMTREDCYDIIDKQSEGGIIPFDWGLGDRVTTSDLCKVVTAFAQSHESEYGNINCRNEQWFKLEQYYLNEHSGIYVDTDDNLEDIKKSSKTRSILLFIYDLFSFVIFFQMIRKLKLNRIYLPSFFSIFNSQAHYNIVKIQKKKQLNLEQNKSWAAKFEKFLDILFFVYFLFITFVFPIYVIAQISYVYSNASFFCGITQESISNYQSNLKKLIDAAVGEQGRGSGIFSDTFSSQYEKITNYSDMCSNSHNIAKYLFGSFRQTLITIQLLLIIVKSILNIITIIKKYWTNKHIDFYELRKDLNLHSVPYVGKEEIFPLSDDPSSIKVEDYEESENIGDSAISEDSQQQKVKEEIDNEAQRYKPTESLIANKQTQIEQPNQNDQQIQDNSNYFSNNNQNNRYIPPNNYNFVQNPNQIYQYNQGYQYPNNQNLASNPNQINQYNQGYQQNVDIPRSNKSINQQINSMIASGQAQIQNLLNKYQQPQQNQFNPNGFPQNPNNGYPQ